MTNLTHNFSVLKNRIKKWLLLFNVASLILACLVPVSLLAGEIGAITKMLPSNTVIISIKVPIKLNGGKLEPDVPANIENLFINNTYEISYDNEKDFFKSNYAIITGGMAETNFNKMTETINNLNIADKIKIKETYTKNNTVLTNTIVYPRYNKILLKLQNNISTKIEVK